MLISIKVSFVLQKETGNMIVNNQTLTHETFTKIKNDLTEDDNVSPEIKDRVEEGYFCFSKESLTALPFIIYPSKVGNIDCCALDYRDLNTIPVYFKHSSEELMSKIEEAYNIAK